MVHMACVFVLLPRRHHQRCPLLEGSIPRRSGLHQLHVLSLFFLFSLPGQVDEGRIETQGPALQGDVTFRSRMMGHMCLWGIC
ncbi:hypothetical protein LEMLEM_LOCUS14140, partial [Lemmus lemmus]